ncbi:hypothetical protein CPB97_002790 [Podila verticillata]|nr:hypothetical protein CPB97_002790 [Podila verticillata]
MVSAPHSPSQPETAATILLSTTDVDSGPTHTSELPPILVTHSFAKAHQTLESAHYVVATYLLGVQIEKRPASESIQTPKENDKDTPPDTLATDAWPSQHVSKETKQLLNKDVDPNDTKDKRRPDLQETTPSSSRTTNSHSKRKAEGTPHENGVVDPSDNDSFKARKKDRQWKRKQRKVEKMHQWKQKAGLEDPPL